MPATWLVAPHTVVAQGTGQPTDTASCRVEADGEVYTVVAVLLSASSRQALAETAAATGYTETDVVNRALHIYQLVEDLRRDDGGQLRLWHRDGRVESILPC